ncbi:aromatic-L-amino-acid decarboxylase [Ramaria rubella]|nr:aromatic-L-amino-acid decarboxylase [Ramaria rubella]
MNIEEFRKAGYQAIDRICDYYYSLENRPVVSKVEPGYLRKALPGKHILIEGEKFEKVADDFRDLILPGVTHWQHPSFFAYFPTASTHEGVLGDLYASTVANPGFNWICSPACTELEAVVMDWSAKLFGLSEAFYNTSGIGGGVIQTTASDSALTAVVAARHRYTHLHPEVPLEKLVIYVTTQTHSLGKKAALILGLSYRALEVKPEDAYGLRGSVFSDAIQEDKANGKHPFILIGTIGTTNTGAIDRIDELGNAVHAHDLWLHVDAAWAGVTLACPEYRELCQLDAINAYAHSFCINFHKWGLVNFDASTLWVRDRKFLTNALDVTPEYLRTAQSEEGTVIDYRNWQLPLGRKFRSLKIWFVLRGFGAQGFRDHLRKGIALSDKFAALVKASSQFELVVQPSLALTVFRLVPPGGNKSDTASVNTLNRIFHSRLSSTSLFLTQTDVNGIFCIRMAVGATRTMEKHITQAWDILCAETEPALEEWSKSQDPVT